ncbi:MAG: GAF domain-containing protein [Gammaproteobacteria bacterium]|jgi:HD-GYP domain-containing protein (c-di-GMP phosphodiesterase class II)|nr:GAF domain-containing protein [Gammaproteobacteria bacterium]MBT3724244.1 GAF domain-containing protein [Gammaproteobacteria bacterium]MBT4078954.1 GAF domain-containing protein [Gammaproteobacteria bacterium]MBT4193702.1 GAF domain-containing protein [Gammaproteobacteria bacterium]MBT4448383.1 GAF domain-containing protein [Gammaproteobacteria bacterium]
MNELLERIDRLTEIGIALSAEKNTGKLLELIMMGAKALTHADGGTLYFVKDDTLTFEIISNDSLAIQMGGTSGNKIEFDPLPIYLKDGTENHNVVVSHCVLSGKTINIEDAYHEEGFDFTGARRFDKSTGYKTQSILTFPLKDHEHEIIGVLQLINAKDPDTGEVISFNDVDQHLAESLASQAAVALTQKRLLKELQVLFEAFIKMIASAIDDKSPYTGGHCRRIPVLTMMLAEAVNNVQTGPMRKFHITNKDRYELETAAWLHDCGKVVTPEYVMDKSTKLETIYDRIHLIEMRVEVLLRDQEIAYLKACLDAQQQGHEIDDLTTQYQKNIEEIKADLEFLQQVNVGGEFMTDEYISQTHSIAKRQLIDMSGKTVPLLSEEELVNINIRKGTLNDGERKVINHHIVATINMLESLPFPKHLKNVPEYAGGHHEKMDGTGYPKGLKKEEMSIQTRIMAIADIFEALTASDRPYKKGKKLSECLKIMGFMTKDNHIDADLYDIFISEKVYLKYAEEFLEPEQIDAIDEKTL